MTKHNKIENKMNRPIFVYGILKNNPGAVSARVHGFRMIDMGHFPAAIPSCGNDTLIGELIHVDDARVKRFDMIEGHPNFYRRQGVKVVTADCEEVDAEMYVINEAYWERSISGDRLLIETEDEVTTYEYNLDG